MAKNPELLRGKDLVRMALRKSLKYLFQADLSPQPENPSPVRYTLKAKFQDITKLAITAKKLNVDFASWHEKVEQTRLEVKDEYIFSNDPVAAVEVDEVYCEYLMELGEYDEAIRIALHITEGYVELNDDRLKNQNEQNRIRALLNKNGLKERKNQALINIASRFVVLGYPERAAKLISDSVPDYDLNRDGFGYFVDLLEYYKKNGSPDSVRDFIEYLNKRIQSIDPETGQRTSVLENVRDKAAAFLFDVEAMGKSTDEAIKQIEKIVNPRIKIKKQMELIKKLLSGDKPENVLQIVGDLVTRIINFLNANTATSDLDDNRENTSPFSAIGSIHSTGQSDEAPKKLFKQHERVEILTDLADILAEFPDARKLFERCVYGSDPDAKDSLVTSITRVAESRRPNLWSRVMRAFAYAKDVESLEEYYKSGSELYPNSQDFLREEYIRCLYDLDPKKALDLIFAFQDPKEKVTIFAEYIFFRIYGGGESFPQLVNYIDQLYAMESEIIAEERSDFDMSDLDSLAAIESDKGEDLKNFLPVPIMSGSITISFGNDPEKDRFYRFSNGLLANLARLAIKKGEWHIISQVLEDGRLMGYMKVMVISEVTRWLQDGTEPGFLY